MFFSAYRSWAIFETHDESCCIFFMTAPACCRTVPAASPERKIFRVGTLMNPYRDIILY